tara:strand:- start:1430 stop:1615 length:186 start_codon:yes stop_codon:yes gene_type:complete
LNNGPSTNATENQAPKPTNKTMVKYFAGEYKDELTQEMTLADVFKAQEMLSQCVKRNYTDG